MKYTRVFVIIIISLYSSVYLSSDSTLNFSAIEGSAYTNFATTVMKEVYDRLDLDFVVTPLPAKRSLVSSNAGGELDGELFRISGIERTYTNLIPIEVPLSASYWMVLTVDKNFEVDGWESLQPYRIGVRHGIATTDRGTEGMNTFKANTNEQLITMLINGRVDIVVMSENNIKGLNHLITNSSIVSLEQPVQIIPVYHFLHKSNILLVPHVRGVLEDLKAEGFITRTFNKHLEELNK